MNFAILGGDRRSVYMAQALEALGHRVRCAELEGMPSYTPAQAMGRADAVILPIPTKSLPIPPAQLPTHIPIFGGGVAPELRQALPNLTDLLASEPLAVENAALTARAALTLLQQALPYSLQGQAVLIVGFGRIGKLLGLQLTKAGAQVTVAARDPVQRAWAKALGMEAVDITSQMHHQILVNTVPARVIDPKQLPARCVLMELASAPGGFDPAEAAALGHTVLPAGGLPGKLLPQSAGEALAKAVLEAM